MNLKVCLQTNDSENFMCLESVIKFKDSSGYKCSLVVQANGFSCNRPFYFSEAYLSNAIKKLEEMDELFNGEAVLGEEYEDSEIRISISALGHVGVFGTIREHSTFMQRLDFGFHTDQTVLKPFISDLKRIQKIEPTD